MKRIIEILALVFFTTLFSTLTLAADVKIAYVNVTAIYNKSAFVETANKILQQNVKTMEAKLQTERSALQAMVNDFQKATVSSKKEALSKKIVEAQTHLASTTQQYQKEIQNQQNAGMQKFTSLVQTAVEKIVKEQHINVVMNSSSIVYTDSSWIDITKDVAAAMQQK